MNVSTGFLQAAEIKLKITTHQDFTKSTDQQKPFGKEDVYQPTLTYTVQEMHRDICDYTSVKHTCCTISLQRYSVDLNRKKYLGEYTKILEGNLYAFIY